MRGERAIGIIPDKALFDRHPRQFRNRDLDARHLLPAQIVADNDRNKAVLAARLAQHAALFGLAELHDAAQRPQCCCEINGLFRHNDDAEVSPVVGEGDAKPVEDPSTHRREQPQVDAVLLREHRISITLQDLQLVQAGDQCGSQHTLPHGKQRSPAGEKRVALCVARHGAQT